MMLDSEERSETGLSFDVATVAIQGARDYQEDSILANFPLGQKFGFAVIADGVGGHVSGHVASGLVTTEIYSYLKINETALGSGTLNIPVSLREAADIANARIADHIQIDDETHGMGSTLLVPVIKADKLFWLSIGDSPLLLFRAGALRQLNKDHSMAPQIDMMVKMGSMKPEVGRVHPDRNALVSVINGSEIAMIDCPTAPLTLQPEDIVIAASDGLQSLSNAAIANTLMLAKDGRSIDIANALLAMVQHLDNPEQDNTVFCVIKLGFGSTGADEIHAEDIPVLAMADSAQDPAPESEPEPVPIPEQVDAAKERKAYFYRGQKYYKDD
jgi:serine/threonine protein phosphatase PrpC